MTGPEKWHAATVDAVFAFLVDSTNHLRQKCSMDDVAFYPPKDVWRRLSGDVFVPILDLRPRPLSCAEQHLDELRALQSYENSEALLTDAPNLPPAGEALSNGLNGFSFEVDAFLVDTLRRALERAGSFDVSDEVTEAISQEVVSALEEEEHVVDLLLPLPRFACDGLPIRLEPDLEIVTLTDDDLSLLLDARRTEVQPVGALSTYEVEDFEERTRFRVRGSAVRTTSSAGVRYRYRVPVVMGDNSRELETNQKMHDRALHTILEVPRVVSLVKRGHIWIPGVLRRTLNALFEGSYGFAGDEPNTGREVMVLEGADIQSLRTLWSAYRTDAVMQSTWLSEAVRRFSIASSRHRDEDRLVDLITAAEAVFLRDSFDELSYKLSVRAAFFLGSDRSDRIGTFELFRSAYSARSQVVHGSTPKLRNVTLAELVDELEATMRRALVRAIELASRGVHLQAWEHDFVL